MSLFSEFIVPLARAAAHDGEQAAVHAAPRMAVKALPAPQRVLALPKPAPKLDPRFKPRGGQWHPDVAVGERDPAAAGFSIHDRGEYAPEGARFQVIRPDGSQHRAPTTLEDAQLMLQRAHAGTLQNMSPEAAARKARPVGMAMLDMDHATDPPTSSSVEWLKKALTKYYKNDFGTANDPLADLAERGLHYDPDMTREKWIDTTNSSIAEDPIGYYTVPPHASGTGDTSYDPLIGPQITQAAPWLAKAPATDNLYGISSPLDLGHFDDEMANALDPGNPTGLPSSLAVRPESLQRMSFPQAVEHVGRINQFRAKEMERAAQAQLDNPAIQLHKDYGDGMRWVELRKPQTDNAPEDALETALKHEGNTMGHCVGGYCYDVERGNSRIFSLRDAQGQPHVTIETAPPSPEENGYLSGNRLNEIEPGLFDRYNQQRYTDGGIHDMHQFLRTTRPDLYTGPESIVQIKGKQNRAPVDAYLPYVQDFVKNGQWGDIGDYGNTGLTKLPDGRHITVDQWREGAANMLQDRNPAWDANWVNQQMLRNYRNVEQNPTTIRDRWPDIQQYFEGYRRGGPVSTLAVRRAA